MTHKQLVPSLLVCLTVIAGTKTIHAAQLYALTDLGLAGGTGSYGTAINDHGHAVGYYTAAANQTRAFYWTPGGGMQDLGGIANSKALDINNNENIVGYSDQQAFRWRRQRAWSLSTLRTTLKRTGSTIVMWRSV